MLKCSVPNLRNFRNEYQQLSLRCLVLDPVTLKSVLQDERGGGSADVMTTETLENFPKDPAVEISPLKLLRMSQSHPPSSQQLEATEVSQLSQPGGLNVQESHLID
ncbi:hypothetical protein RRG08_030339 [Elysia crispata]|uniref:Uncharacterized protein n=1 Tax=Elysia crispata TaxID=231223 RepID=A0AAE0YIS1_9GAST|nr:hypothetical protein RRG08_030339 [Elysia crispata]